MQYTVSHILPRLSAYRAGAMVDDTQSASAAVALVLCGSDSPSLLMIKRAQRQGDPWSGHMAFPGGRTDVDDVSPYATAMRECEEELGLALNESQCLTALTPRFTLLHNHQHRVLVYASVFYVPCLPRLKPNREVADYTLIALDDFSIRERYDTFIAAYDAVSYTMPSFNHELGRVWGLSLRFIDELLDIVGN